MEIDPLAKFKQAQKEGWSNFIPVETATTPTAARLVSFAGIQSGQNVLDVGCGTGVVAVTAAQRGARVTGADLTPELIERARENSKLAGVEIDWQVADVEALPFTEGQFDVVVSQYGHMFAPRPEGSDRRNAARSKTGRHDRVLDLAAGVTHRGQLQPRREIHAATAARSFAAATMGRRHRRPRAVGFEGKKHSIRSRPDALSGVEFETLRCLSRTDGRPDD